MEDYYNYYMYMITTISYIVKQHAPPAIYFSLELRHTIFS